MRLRSPSCPASQSGPPALSAVVLACKEACWPHHVACEGELQGNQESNHLFRFYRKAVCVGSLGDGVRVQMVCRCRHDTLFKLIFKGDFDHLSFVLRPSCATSGTQLPCKLPLAVFASCAHLTSNI